MKKYHYVYEITNNANNKKYIGKHSTDNLEDGYMGSGKIVASLPKNLLTKRIIEYCDSEAQAYEREKYWIQYYDAYNNREYYNLDEGGVGNSTQEMKDRWKNGVYDSTSFRQKLSETMAYRMRTDTNLIQKRQEGWQNWWDNMSEEERENWKRSGEKNGMYGKSHSEESKQKNRLSQPGLEIVYCDEESDKIFYGLGEAAKWAGLKAGTTIGRCINGKQKTAGKHPVTGQKCHWHRKD